MVSDPLFYAAAVPAVILLGLSKGGFLGIGTLALPLMALAIAPLEAAAIMLPILIVQDVFSVWAYRREFDRRNLVILLPGAIVGILLGYLLAARIWERPSPSSSAPSRSPSQRIACSSKGVRRRPPTEAGTMLGLLCGAASGFTSMISHAGGPPFQIYTVPQRLERNVFVGTSVVFFRGGELDQGAALSGARPTDANDLGDLPRLLSAGDRLDLCRHLAGAAGPADALSPHLHPPRPYRREAPRRWLPGTLGVGAQSAGTIKWAAARGRGGSALAGLFDPG